MEGSNSWSDPDGASVSHSLSENSVAKEDSTPAIVPSASSAKQNICNIVQVFYDWLTRSSKGAECSTDAASITTRISRHFLFYH